MSFSLKTFQCETQLDVFFQIIVNQERGCVFALFTFILD